MNSLIIEYCIISGKEIEIGLSVRWVRFWRVFKWYVYFGIYPGV